MNYNLVPTGLYTHFGHLDLNLSAGIRSLAPRFTVSFLISISLLTVQSLYHSIGIAQQIYRFYPISIRLQILSVQSTGSACQVLRQSSTVTL